MVDPKSEISAPVQLARNSLFNLATQILLLGLGMWAVPIVLHGITEEKFGLLSLVWLVLGYFTMIDFGISRAVTRYIATAVNSQDHAQLTRLTTVALTLTLALGVVSGLLVWLSTPMLVSSLFAISPSIQQEAIESFRLSSFALPFVLITGTTRGIQMGLQRFDVVNILLALLGVIQWVGAVVLVWLQQGLIQIVELFAISRGVVCIASFIFLGSMMKRVYDVSYALDAPTMQKLLKFGGWVSISQFIGPLLHYLDRIVIGAFLTMSALAYYSVPQELVNRLTVIPMSLSLALFPMFSQQSAIKGQDEQRRGYYRRSVKYLFSILFPLTVAAVAVAGEFLTWWMGGEFAAQATTVLQIIGVGFLFNSLAQIPVTALQAGGLPNVTAKLHMAECIPTVALTVLCVKAFGLTGAAVAWMVRVTTDCALLFLLAHRLLPREKNATNVGVRSRVILQNLALLILVVGATVLAEGAIKFAILGLALGAYGISLWYITFDDQDRLFVSTLPARVFQLPTRV